MAAKTRSKRMKPPCRQKEETTNISFLQRQTRRKAGRHRRDKKNGSRRRSGRAAAGWPADVERCLIFLFFLTGWTVTSAGYQLSWRVS